MTGRNKFSSLKTHIGADRLEQVEAKTKTMLAEMLLPEIRKHSGMTQKEVAAVLGISQPGLSKIENQDDMQIGTLSKLIEAMGGTLEIIAHLPQGDCRLTQFGD
jgi:predicted XRE-type DNA-binding protein